MNTKKLLLVTGLFAGLCSWSQKDTLRFNMNDNEVIIITDDINKLATTDINGMVAYMTSESQKITADYNARVDALTAKYKAGEISEEQYEAQMELEAERFEVKMEAVSESMEEWSEEYAENYENWAEEYAEAWEDWAEKYSDDWEDWAEEWERQAEASDDNNSRPPMPPPPGMPTPAPNPDSDGTTITISPDGVDINDGDTKIEYDFNREKKQRRTEGQGDIHFGWNNMILGDAIVRNENGELRGGQSTFFTLGSAAKTRIGGNHSIFYVRYGLQFNWHHLRLKGNNVITKTTIPDGTAFVPIQDIKPAVTNVSFSSYNITYFDLPVLLILDFSKKGMDNGFNFGVGGYGGVRVTQKRNLIYDDQNNDPIKEKIRNNFYMNQWRYGVMAQVGFGAFKITGKYDLNEVFRSDKATPNYQLGSLAFGFAF